MELKFEQDGLFEALELIDNEGLDKIGFGIVKMDRKGNILAYNKWESQLAANNQAEVIGKNFFTQIAPCTNNFMVSEKFGLFKDQMDETMDYVFTYRIKPTPVRLRLLAKDSSSHQYLAVQLKS
jgi:photoactive yellow protein